MRLRDFQRAEEYGVMHCPVRDICPVGMVCGAGSSNWVESGKLMPAVIDFERGDLLWTDLRFERHVFVIREGVLSCMAHIEPDEEAPFTLYGAGVGVGLADLYVPYESTSTYHLHAVVPGKICSLPSKVLKRNLESLTGETQQRILAASLYNQSTGALLQSIISSRPLLCHRISLLLTGVQALASRSTTQPDTLCLTHDEIASIVLSDRASVTRALHQMEEKGFVRLGYRSIEISEALRAKYADWIETCATFCAIKEGA